MQLVNNAFSDRMKVIWYTWISILVLTFAYTICAFAAAAMSDSKAYGFFVIWNMLLLLAYTGGGTLILRRVPLRTPLAIGFMIGVSVMFVMMWLHSCVLSGANIAKPAGPLPAAVEAVTVFSAFLFLDSLFFTTILVLYRDVLLPATPMATQSDSDLPPPAPQFSSAPAPAYSYTSESGMPGKGGMDAYGAEEHVTVPTAGPAGSVL